MIANRVARRWAANALVRGARAVARDEFSAGPQSSTAAMTVRSFEMLRLIGVCSCLALLLAGGCEREEVRVYEAPADPVPAQPAEVDPPAQPAAVPAASASGTMQWTLPDGWRELDEPRPMRIATLEAREARAAAGEGEPALQVAISAFPGTTGGNLANVNRWREQFGLPPLTEVQLDEHLQPFQSATDDAVSGWTVRIEGRTPPVRPGGPPPAGSAMLGAIIQGDPQRTWFARADGDPELLDAHQAGFERLARSFRFVDGAAEPEPGGY
jgi:hypothetical protein